MRAAYPILITKGEKYLIVYIPDFDISTQGTDLVNAIEMARDAIGLTGIDMEDENETLPVPSELGSVQARGRDCVATLVDVDFTEYRRKNEIETVRRNVSLPYWLNDEAERAGINVSAVLQGALKRELKIS